MNARVGKNILRLFTTAMYGNPLLLYREYIQNAADSIDDSRKDNNRFEPRIDIFIDQSERMVSIRDNGSGIADANFLSCMTGLGCSSKKYMVSSRGLWGIGRLSGIGYCKHLSFKTKAAGEGQISNFDWDVVHFSKLLMSSDDSIDALSLVKKATSFSQESCDPSDESFFQVTLHDVIRHGNDIILNEDAVKKFLEQIAPVPFASEFKFHRDINEFLSPHVDVSGISIYLNNSEEPICRPFRNKFSLSSQLEDSFTELEPIQIPGHGDQLAAVGWIAHHNYFGSLQHNQSIAGLRIRCGNIQVGDNRILLDIFPEERFNSWCVGEIHIIDERLVPNGSRDNFENNAFYRELVSRLKLNGRAIARLCRSKSSERNMLRKFEKRASYFIGCMNLIEKGLIEGDLRKKLESQIEDFHAKINSADLPMCEKTPHLKQLVSNNFSVSTKMKEKHSNSNGRKIVAMIFNHSNNEYEALSLAERIVAEEGL